MKLVIILSVFICFFMHVSYAQVTQPAKGLAGHKEMVESIVVPIGGNTWKSANGQRGGSVSNKGIVDWSDAQTTFTSYVRMQQKGTVKLWLVASTPAGKSSIKVTLNGISKKVEITVGLRKDYYVGEWNVKDTGYIAFQISGAAKTGDLYADITDLKLAGTAVNEHTRFVKNNDDNFFYWGRRGPSVHLSYPFADSIKAKWFYNEVTVPEQQDVIGSYFMANGFGEGYFGIQVNSATERRILFSVWSPFVTDDPKSIPQDQRITLVKKGAGVYTGEFGNEGSGGQSFLRYNWKAGTTYKFLLKGEPDGANHTVYTAYFFAPEKGDWMLIASFKRPNTNTYLKRFHSFLENFIPEQGDKERRVLFGNQWIADAEGNWTELTRAVFTYDNTAAKAYRMDYAGGVTNDKFFLKNCGFFSEYTPGRSAFERLQTNRQPQIDFEKLP